uniref:Protein-serine/threonine kinase n=1 Tax=Mycena chlorophos TaxID=658473 RepID=A0ABQ0M824_MYCCL|nr:alpha-ketoacid dehydrogenase kinase N-terminal domain-containing protein [Mycena chlorophos]
MGFTGLARWVNAPAHGLKLVQENLLLNHNGVYKAPWNLSISLYRSTLANVPDRTIFTLTMDQNVFVLVDDPAAPNRADVVDAGQEALYLQRHLHYRYTFLTLRPPSGLEQLLAQLNARWKPVREVNAQRGQPSQQLAIEGYIYALGTDWIVRVGNVVLPGGAIRGMVLEAEYLPLPILQSPDQDGSSELLSNLLTSILPMVDEAKIVAVTISDAQWKDVLWDGEDSADPGPVEEENEDDIYAWGDAVPHKKNDWQGVDRDRRSAFLILGGLRSESLLGLRQPDYGHALTQTSSPEACDSASTSMFKLSARRVPQSPHLARSESTALSQHHLFYQNKQLELYAAREANRLTLRQLLELYAAREANRLTLRQLLFFGRSTSDAERLIKSANYVRTELPIRIAHRLRDMQKLPFIVVTQEGVARVYELYWSAFEKFRRYPQINTVEDNEAFCRFLTDILKEHWTVIPSLSLGLSLASPHLSPDVLDSFMRRMLISRISRRVLAEHHIALSDMHSGKTSAAPEPHVGIIFTALDVKRSLEKCVNILRNRGKGWPEIVVDGHAHTRFAYIKEHLEYVLFEILKNAMQATAAHHRGAEDLPPIRATISAGANEVSVRISDRGGGLATVKTPSDLFSFSHLRNATRMENSQINALRNASTNPLGMRATVTEQVDRWQQDVPSTLDPVDPEFDPEVQAGVGHAKVGIGLPMSNIFATYFGGSLELVTMQGYGTDVYLRLPRLGTNLEGIEV